MGGDLVPRPGGVGHGSRALVPSPAAQSTARVAFSGAVVTWADLPSATRRVARRPTPVVAEAVQVDPRVWREKGRAVERATGWRAYDDAVVVVDVVRPVAPAASGGTRPVGRWEHRGLMVAPVTGAPRRRRGVVEVAGELGPTGGRVRDAAARADVNADQRAAAEAWSYLPQVVRSAAERLVPVPLVWLGELVQARTRDGFPATQDVRVLRMSADRAVVVLASRTLSPIPGAGVELHVAQMSRVPWIVEQVGLDLGESTVRGRIGSTRTGAP